MDFFDAVKARRSIRKYTDKPVPREVMDRALDAAILAPNSSNIQAWGFYWVQDPAKKKKLVEHCMSQSAARTAQELVVVVANPSLWRKTNPEMKKFLNTLPKVPTIVKLYYDKVVPATYGWKIFTPFKWLIYNLIGIFKPFMRRPATCRDLQEVWIKSAALGAENFMLAMAAQGFATCPMEGMDEPRIKRLLRLPWSARVAMVISVGEAASNGTWGPQARFQRDWFIHYV
ncbi:MAG: nitroreductase family protein [Bdellovibrionales bacterium]|nr:nitroreductase family protein [Bdellovibrionales bacterium]